MARPKLCRRTTTDEPAAAAAAHADHHCVTATTASTADATGTTVAAVTTVPPLTTAPSTVPPFPLLDLRIPVSSISVLPTTPLPPYLLSETVTVTYFEAPLFHTPIYTTTSTPPSTTFATTSPVTTHIFVSTQPPRSIPDIPDLNKMGDTELPGYDTDIGRYFVNEEPEVTLVSESEPTDHRSGKEPMQEIPTRRMTRSVAARKRDCGSGVATAAGPSRPQVDSSTSDSDSDETFQADLGQKRNRIHEDPPSDLDDDLDPPPPPSRATRRQRTTRVSRPRSFEERYNLVLSKILLVERCFDPTLMRVYDFLEPHLTAHGWSNLIDRPCVVNLTLVREFYTAITGSLNDVVRLRGVRLRFDGAAINSALGFIPPAECHFARLFRHTTPADDAAIAATLALPGFGWTPDGNCFVIRSGHLTLMASLWFLFVRFNLMPTVHDTTLSRRRCILLYCIMTDCHVDLGPIMTYQIREAASRSNSRLIYPGLLTRLFRACRVPAYEDDDLQYHSSTIDQGSVDRMKRSFRFGSSRQ